MIALLLRDWFRTRAAFVARAPEGGRALLAAEAGSPKWEFVLYAHPVENGRA
jgi:hypothetical protein